MTTIDSAAAWRAKLPLPLVLAAVFTSISLAGCGTTGNILSSAGGSTDTTAAAMAAAPATAAQPLVAIAPVIGAPEPIAGQFKSSLASALQAKGIAAATTTAQATAYTLRGYIVSARESAGTKVSYIWDVTTPAGQRVHRITGEEVVAAAPASRDPWQAVSPQIIQAIVGKTSSELATWLPTQATAQPAAVAGAVANRAATATNNAVSTATAPVTAAAQNVASAASSAVSGPTTGSIGRVASVASPGGPVSAIVPGVTGAPGDGSVSLANAIRKELERKGVRMASVPTANTFRVEGKVNVGPKNNGAQSIAIDWHVKDATGKNVGTVSQKNQIPAGSLDGAWGQTADAAAAAAAHGITELLQPKNVAAR